MTVATQTVEDRCEHRYGDETAKSACRCLNRSVVARPDADETFEMGQVAWPSFCHDADRFPVGLVR